MKKKLALILFVIIISAGIMYFVSGLQNKYSLKQQEINTTSSDISMEVKPNDDVKTDSKQESSNTEENNNKNDAVRKPNNNENQQKVKQQSSPSSSKSTTENSSTSQNKNTNTNSITVNNQTHQPNFFIVDTVSGKNILSPAYIEYNGETAAQITFKILDASGIIYKPSGFGNSIYFSSIAGIKEREAGPSSGWCFYVNGKKPNVGAGAFKLNKGDVLEWKYLKDGISG